MDCVWWWCCVLCVLGAGSRSVRAETIHFTNSPQLIMASKNYTTYELEVPGSKPITIIEATEPLSGIDRKVDHQLEPPAPTTSFRTSTGLSVSRPEGDEEQQQQPPRKTLYSPELLAKFLREYSEKLRNADSATRQRLNEITMMTSVNQQRKPEQPTENGARVPQDEFVFDDTTHERHGTAASSNKRWYQESNASPGNQKHHPWNVKDGWVTLEAVPWSESKVSKWHAASVSEVPKSQYQQLQQQQQQQQQQGPPAHQSLGNYWASEGDGLHGEDQHRYKPAPPPTSASIGASSYYHGEESVSNGASGGYGGYGGLQNPPESMYNRRRPSPMPSIYGERPDDDNDDDNRGRPQQDSWYDGAHHQLNRDIITDGRPANFPKYAPSTDQPSYGSGTSGPAPGQRNRPVSYPDRGQGEWVLISTTKGYQYPKRRHGQRAITFAPATSTSHQTVKLTVLPMKNAVDMTTSHNGLIEVSSATQTVEDAVRQQKQKQKQQKHKNRRPVATTTASPVVNKRKKHSSSSTPTGTFSVMRRDETQDSSAVLAAVSAGMVPATMAILAPMVLGKKRK